MASFELWDSQSLENYIAQEILMPGATGPRYFEVRFPASLFGGTSPKWLGLHAGRLELRHHTTSPGCEIRRILLTMARPGSNEIPQTGEAFDLQEMILWYQVRSLTDTSMIWIIALGHRTHNPADKDFR